jgi:NAD(P)-dependent dehydrogenase (short-subunit alcohol dehydrogenase family)
MGKTVLISGSSSGIGLETARRFARAGWTVVAGMRNPTGRHTLLHDERTVNIVELDVTDNNSIKKAVEYTIENFGSIEVLVNNAGYGLTGVFEYFEEEKVKKQMDTNFFGILRLTKEVLPYMKTQKSGTIINVASVGGRVTFPFYSFYNATKWAVEGFSESLQHELVQFNIRIKIVEPGPVKTDFYDRSIEKFSPKPGDDYEKNFNIAFKNMEASGRSGISAAKTAKKIFNAATSSNWKLRYPVGTKGVLILRKLLPDVLFNGIIRAVLFTKR